MKAGALIGVGCGVVLGAAVWFAWSSANVEPVVPPHVDEPAPVVAAPPTPRPQLALPPPPPEPAPQPPPIAAPIAEAPPPSAPLPSGSPPPPGAPVPPPPGTPLELVAPSPYTGYSRELDYADNLLAKKNATIEELRSANDVFARCVDQEPDNLRCVESLERSQLAITGLNRKSAVAAPANTMQQLGPRTLPTRLPRRF